MSSMKPDPSSISSETSDDSLEDENILKRVGSLPLVCSVCDLVSSNYTSLKRKNSYLQTMCDGAEKGMKTLTEAAVSRAQPLLTSLEPQLATANKIACRGLDTVEEKVPILQQTADQVVFDTKQRMSSKVTSAKNVVTRKLSGMVGMTKDAVQSSVKTTASLVTSSVSVVMGTRVGKMAKDNMEAMLCRSHAFVDHYLLSDENMNFFSVGSQRGFRMVERTVAQNGVIRIFQQQMDFKTGYQGTIVDPAQKTQAQIRSENYAASVLSLLNKFQHYITKQSWCHLYRANENLQAVLGNRYSEWKGWLIALYYTVTLPLRTTYLIVLFTLDELSAKFHDNVPQASCLLEELQIALSALSNLQDLCWKIFARVWEKMSEEENLNTVLNYIVQSLPFCFFANHCKYRTSTSSTAKALKAIQRVQASRDSLLALQESGISPVTAT